MNDAAIDDWLESMDFNLDEIDYMINPNITINDDKITIEQTVDILIEISRKISNIFTLETARLIKAALVNNKHSEKPVSELEVFQKMAKEREKSIVLYTNAGRQDLARIKSKELDCMPKEPSEKEIEELIAELMEATTLTIKDTKGVIADVQSRFPTAQKGTIVKIFKSLL